METSLLFNTQVKVVTAINSAAENSLKQDELVWNYSAKSSLGMILNLTSSHLQSWQPSNYQHQHIVVSGPASNVHVKKNEEDLHTHSSTT